jgi:hypothetical protein
VQRGRRGLSQSNGNAIGEDVASGAADFGVRASSMIAEG